VGGVLFVGRVGFGVGVRVKGLGKFIFGGMKTKVMTRRIFIFGRW
jgi:hypothetical protein